MELVVLMSHAGRIVSIYEAQPSEEQCQRDYATYLGESDLPPGTVSWNCWLEKWQVQPADATGERLPFPS